MRTRFLQLFASLTGGAALTVVVAWACAAWSPVRLREDSPQLSWGAPTPQFWPTSPDSATIELSLGLTQINASGRSPSDQPGRRGTAQWVFQAGLPFRCLHRERHRVEAWTELYFPLSLDMFYEDEPWTNGLAMPTFFHLRYDYIRRFPVRPMWPGFALNTLIYSGLVFTILLAPGVVRRSFRARSNRCIECGYMLLDAQRCTECGRTLNQPLQRAAHSTVRVHRMALLQCIP